MIHNKGTNARFHQITQLRVTDNKKISQQTFRLKHSLPSPPPLKNKKRSHPANEKRSLQTPTNNNGIEGVDTASRHGPPEVHERPIDHALLSVATTRVAQRGGRRNNNNEREKRRRREGRRGDGSAGEKKKKEGREVSWTEREKSWRDKQSWS